MNVTFDYPADSETKASSMTIPEAAKSLKARSQPWALVVDENYGEGSAREHAAMQPRFLGCGLIVARSFARCVQCCSVLKSKLFGLCESERSPLGSMRQT